MPEEPEPQESRESIWSVPAGWLRLYLALFVIETSVCLGLVIWHEIAARAPGDNFVAVLIAVGGSMAPLILTIATANVGLVEVTYMLDRLIGERYRQHRYRVGRREAMAEAEQAVAEAEQAVAEAEQAVAEAEQAVAEARQEAAEVRQEVAEVRQEAQQEVAEARQEARQEAQQEAQQRLDEWNNRRLAAQAAGEPFTEPPPSLYSPNGKASETE